MYVYIYIYIYTQTMIKDLIVRLMEEANEEAEHKALRQTTNTINN